MNIENKKQIATILLAVGLGLVATFLTSQYVQNNIAQQTKILAKEYTQQTTALQKELEINKRGLSALGQKHEMLVAQVQSQPKVVVQAGRETAQPPVSPEAFSVVMPPGKRAMTLRVDTLLAVGGLISPGDFVDVIAVLRIPEDPDTPAKTKDVTTVLFQNLQVLAVGALFQSVGGAALYEIRQNAPALNITLAVSPEEAGLLTFAQANGKFAAILALFDGKDRQMLQVASWDALSGYVLDKQGTELPVPYVADEPPPAPKSEEKVEKPKPSIQIFRAGREL